MSHGAPYWYTLYSLSCATPYWVKVHPAELHSTPYELSRPIDLRWTLLSYAVPYWDTLYCTLPCYAAPCELHYSLTELLYCARTIVQLCKMPECRIVRYRIKGNPSPVPECRNTDAGGIGLDADAQLCHTVHSIVYKNFVKYWTKYFS